MEIRDAIKSLRSELGITQVELATALNITSATVSRWELGLYSPTRSAISLILNYARAHDASPECIARIKQATVRANKSKLDKKHGDLFSIEHSSLAQLVDDTSFPIYVCDLATDKLLYVNKKARAMIGDDFGDVIGQPCYRCIMHRDAPCDVCHKAQLTEDRFTNYDVYRPFDGTLYRVQGRRMQWNGRDAQVRCVLSVGQTVTVQRERENNYTYQLRSRKQAAAGCVAMAHYNLTKNTVGDIQSDDESLIKIMMRGSVDAVLNAISRHTYDDAEQSKFDSVRDRSAMLNLFYNGTTHVSIRHHLKGDKRLYETTFDMMQNPSTFDIEAVAVLRNITDGALIEEVASALLGLDYEIIVLIDAETGEAHPLTSGHINGVVVEQKQSGNAASGVEAYLRAHCLDGDVERVIHETSLPYVNEQLKTKRRHTVSYTLKQDGGVIHKRTFFTYLDKSRTTILCAVQDITNTYNDEVVTHDRLSAALEIIRQISGVDIGRYDMRTKTLYSNSNIMTALGYGGVIGDAPETFIRDGRVAPESVAALRRFYAALGSGETASATVALAVAGGGFHWFRIKSKTLRDESGEPDQAIIVYQDINEQREQATVYGKWKRSIESREPASFTLFRCNLNQGAAFDRMEGELLSTDYIPEATTFDDRAREYARRSVHPDDQQSYIELLTSETLLRAYRNGIAAASINYREQGESGEYRWIHLSLEMAQYPDGDDIEVFLLYEKVE